MFVIKSLEAASLAAHARVHEHVTHGQVLELLRMLEAIGIVKIEPEVAAPAAPAQQPSAGQAPAPSAPVPEPPPVAPLAPVAAAPAPAPAAPAAEVPGS